MPSFRPAILLWGPQKTHDTPTMNVMIKQVTRDAVIFFDIILYPLRMCGRRPVSAGDGYRMDPRRGQGIIFMHGILNMAISTKSAGRYDMIVMGASTGGPPAVKILFSGLPADFPVGIVYVQHTEDSFYRQYADWLNQQTELTVRLAGNDDYPGPGEVLLAPAGFHLVFREGRLFLEDSPRVMNLRPCIDKLFMSAAENFGSRLIGLILTGMGSDGARGCVEIVAHKGYTIAQDEETSVIFGMARVAIARDGISVVLPLDQIGGHLKKLVIA
jgi:chemotaxis response regulator CheB